MPENTSNTINNEDTSEKSQQNAFDLTSPLERPGEVSGAHSTPPTEKAGSPSPARPELVERERAGERSYFQLYNLPTSFHPDQAAVKSRFYELSRQYHPDRATTGDAAALTETLRMAADINRAYKILRDPDATMAYILKQNNLLEEEEKYALPPAFLMEMMDLNEAISDYEDMPDNESARLAASNNLAEQLQAWETTTALLTHRFDHGEHDNTLLLQIKDMYFRKKYLLRIKERIEKNSGI